MDQWLINCFGEEHRFQPHETVSPGSAPWASRLLHFGLVVALAESRPQRQTLRKLMSLFPTVPAALVFCWGSIPRFPRPVALHLRYPLIGGGDYGVVSRPGLPSRGGRGSLPPSHFSIGAGSGSDLGSVISAASGDEMHVTSVGSKGSLSASVSSFPVWVAASWYSSCSARAIRVAVTLRPSRSLLV